MNIRVGLALFAAIGSGTGAGASLASDCDPTLMGVVGDRLGYRQRVDRCEGVYWEPHAARDMISVVSYTNGQLPTSPAIPDPLPLGWAASTDGSSSETVSLRAASLSASLYYRMDATRPRTPGTYQWPTDVLRELKQLTLSDLGFLATTRESVGGVNWTIYLPVSVGTPPPNSPSLALTLAATMPIKDLDWECLRIEPTGLPGNRVAGGRLPGQLQMLESTQLRLPIPGFSGLCYLEIRAKAVGAGLDPLITMVIRVPRGSSATEPERLRGPRR